MRAAVIDRYGAPEVVRIEEVSDPKPGAHAVLVRVKAVAVTSGDARIRAGRFPRGFAVPARLAFGITRPRRPILGSACSGVIEAVGAHVSGLAPGDEVCGMTGAKMGAHAELVVVPVGKLARKPPSVTHEDAAGLLFGGSAALYFLRDKAAVDRGMSVLINGGSGAIGTNAVQLAKHLGATVVAVTSAANTALAYELGADRTIDYATRPLGTLEERFDVVFDTVGNLSIASGRRLLSDNGVLLLAVASLGDMLQARGRVVAGSAPERAADFEHLLHLVDSGALVVVHDQHFDLEHIADAYRLVDTGHKRGNVIVCP